MLQPFTVLIKQTRAIKQSIFLDVYGCHTAESKPVKQEFNGTVILPPLLFPGVRQSIATFFQVCRNVSTTIEPFYDISLDLPAVLPSGQNSHISLQVGNPYPKEPGHFVNLPLHQFVNMSTKYFTNLSFCHLANSSTCHSLNLPFCIQTFHQFAILSI